MSYLVAVYRYNRRKARTAHGTDAVKHYRLARQAMSQARMEKYGE